MSVPTLATATGHSLETKPDYGTKPSYGHRAIVRVIDDVARENPSQDFIFVPRSNDPRDGWQPVSFKQVANAINHVAHRMATELESSPHAHGTFPTLAYIGPNDLRYFIFMLACVKAGNQALFISPRNTVGAQLSLFKATDCTILYSASSHGAIAQQWLQEYDMQTFDAASLETWLEADSPPFPYDKTSVEAESDPLVVLHTSGSTGIPKPIVVRQGSMHVADALHDLPKLDGADAFPQVWTNWATRVLMPMPFFHAAGIFLVATMSVYYNVKLALAVPGQPLSVDHILQCLEHAGVDAALLPPALIEELSTMDQGVEALKRLEFLSFGGGNLSTPVGDMLVEQGVVLQAMIGSTESFPYLLYFKRDPTLWHYFFLDSKAMGVDWRPLSGEPGIYEMVIVRKDREQPGIQAVFFTFPEATEFATRDLYKPHPTLPDHWLWYGRADDIIVLSNGEKLNPVSIEDIVTGHPGVKGALVVGQDRFQPALFLEPMAPSMTAEEAKTFVEHVWPTIEQANRETVAHGRIVKDLVALASPEKPFLRAGKGTVQRAPTTKRYRIEIDRLYDASGAQSLEAIELDLGSREALTRSIIQLFQTRLDAPPLEPGSNFFNAGIDSLQVMNASNLLRSSLETAGFSISVDAVATKVIYRHPTPKQLAGYLYSVIAGGQADQDEAHQEVADADELLKKYTANLATARIDKPKPSDSNQTVILTGSTGSFGAYLLDIMIASPRVQRIIALNRGADGGRSRQPAVSAARGLHTDFRKVEFLSADLSQPSLGVGRDRYDRLLGEADRIIHNAWPVNFNLNVVSFEPHILGVRRLADFSASAAKQVPVLFVSSIGTVDGWTAPEPVPERAISDLSLPTLGYGRSKLVGSLILDAAVESSGIPAASVRVGQIAGPRSKQGLWNKQEFLPSLIASSVYLGVLPASLGSSERVDWVPIEDMANSILELAGVSTDAPLSEISGYYHAINPAATTWAEVAPVLMEFYAGRITKLVSPEEWVRALEESAESSDIDKNPAVKLLDTYRDMLLVERTTNERGVLEVTRTKNHSKTLRHLGPISAELLQNWCHQWDF